MILILYEYAIGILIYCLKSADLDISLAALNIVDEPRSGVGISTSNPQSSVQRASCSIFEEDFDDQDDDY